MSNDTILKEDLVVNHELDFTPSSPALAAVATRVYAEGTVEHDEAAHRVMEVHKAIGLAVLGLAGALFIWRSACKGLFPPFYLSASVVQLASPLQAATTVVNWCTTHGVAVRAVEGAPSHTHEYSHHD